MRTTRTTQSAGNIQYTSRGRIDAAVGTLNCQTNFVSFFKDIFFKNHNTVRNLLGMRFVHTTDPFILLLLSLILYTIKKNNLPPQLRSSQQHQKMFYLFSLLEIVINANIQYFRSNSFINKQTKSLKRGIMLL